MKKWHTRAFYMIDNSRWLRNASLVIALTSIPAIANESIDSQSLTTPHHTEQWLDAPQVSVFWLDGERISVVASCSGCTLFVDALEWTAADNPNAREYLNAPIDIFEGAVDETTLYPSLEPNVPFGLDIVVYLYDDNTNEIRENKETFFGVVGNNELVPLTWTEFACGRGLAECAWEQDDSLLIRLNLPLLDDEMPNEGAE